MQNFDGEHLHVIENVGCRCKICEGSIFKSQKRQDADAIVHDRQAEKHLQVQRKVSCGYIGLKKSIRNSEYQVSADTMVAIKASVQANWQILGQMRSRRQINLYEKIKVYPHHFCKSKMMRIFKIKINGYSKWLVQYPRVLIRRWLRVF